MDEAISWLDKAEGFITAGYETKQDRKVDTQRELTVSCVRVKDKEGCPNGGLLRAEDFRTLGDFFSPTSMKQEWQGQ